VAWEVHFRKFVHEYLSVDGVIGTLDVK